MLLCCLIITSLATPTTQGDGTVSIHQHLEEVKFMSGENT
jgi:hypothetical protein